MLVMDMGIDSCDLQLFSEGIHTFQDSWSHQGRPVDSDTGMGHARGVIEFLGMYFGLPRGILTMLSTSTDDPDRFGADVHEMSEALYENLKKFAKNCPCTCGNSPMQSPRAYDPLWIPYDNNNVVDYDPLTGKYK